MFLPVGFRLRLDTGLIGMPASLASAGPSRHWALRPGQAIAPWGLGWSGGG